MKAKPMKNDAKWLMVKLKALIAEQVAMCNTRYKPYICKLKETKEGYDEIEDFCIRAFFESDMDIADALSQKESMLNPNYTTD